MTIPTPFNRYALTCMIVCLLMPAFCFTQNNYTPFKNDSLLMAALLIRASARFESDKHAISGENKKYIVQEYQDRFDHIKEMYDKKQFITDARAKMYMDSLAGVIIKANPKLAGLHPTILFSKMYWPNAASFGEGTIMFNISLFNRLQNESQAAFVICHELSHFYLQHSNNAIDRYINTLYSKEFQEQLRDIKKSEFQRGKSLDKLMKNISYKTRRHSRDHETQADSMALELMRYSGFDVRESLTCLALLDSVDKEKYLGSLHLAEQLNFPEYPFRKSWLRQQSVTLSEAVNAHNAAMGKTEKDTEADSLKTHPDCNVRIQRLKPTVDQYYTSSQQLFLVSKPQFELLVKCFDYELEKYCYESDEVGRSLYYSLQQHYLQKDNIFLATMIGKCFNQLYHAQLEHRFGRVVDLDSPSDTEEYGLFLRFLQNLKLADIASISYYFMQQQPAEFGTDPEFQKTSKESAALFSALSH